MKYKAIIWDLNDTLTDTSKLYRDSQLIALKSISTIDPMTLEESIKVWNSLLWYYHSDDFEGILRAVCHIQGIKSNNNDIIKASMIADSLWPTKLDLCSGALYCLEQFRKQNIKMGIVSNGEREYELKKIYHTNILEFICAEAIFISPFGYTGAKPNPNNIINCCHVLEVAPETAIYIGDRRSDTIAAKLAKVTSIHIDLNAFDSKEHFIEPLTSLTTPDFTFQSLLEFYDWFDLRD